MSVRAGADPGFWNGGHSSYRGAEWRERGGVWGGGVLLPNEGEVWGCAPSAENFLIFWLKIVPRADPVSNSMLLKLKRGGRKGNRKGTEADVLRMMGHIRVFRGRAHSRLRRFCSHYVATSVKQICLQQTSGGSRHLVWVGPRGAEVEGEVWGGDVPLASYPEIFSIFY